MATIAFTVAGSFVGGSIAGGIGAAIGGFVLGTLGQKVDAELFGGDKRQRPGIDSLKVQISSYAAPIPILTGTMRFGGIVVWADEKNVFATNIAIDGGGLFCGDGFFGGGDQIIAGPNAYSQSFAVLLCEGEIESVTRIWFDSKLVYSLRGGDDDIVSIENLVPTSDGVSATGKMGGLRFRLHKGTETQLPDPWIEEVQGEGNVPAHRGHAYMVFKDLPLQQWGNRIPNVTVEATTSGAESTDSVETGYTLDTGVDSMIVHPDGVHVTMQNFEEWETINILTGEVTATALYDTVAAQIPDGAGDMQWDIDERNIIHSTRNITGSSGYYLVQLDGDTLAILQQTATGNFGGSLESCKHLRVFSNDVFPFLVSINTVDEHLIFTHRDSYEIGTETTDGIHVAPPSSDGFEHCDVDNETGVIWAVSTDAVNGGSFTTIHKITPQLDGSFAETLYDVSANIAGGNLIYYDVDTNQLIVGSEGGDDAGRLSFFDGDTVAFISSIDDIVKDKAKTPFRSGATAGFMYFPNPTDTDEIHKINVSAHTVEKIYTAAAGVTPFNGGGIYDPITHSFLTGTTTVSSSKYARILLDRFEPIEVTVASAVEKLCEKVDLGVSSELDTSELTDTLYGILTANRGSARSAIQPLINGFFFDAVESDGLIKFPVRGGASVVTINDDDLSAHVSGSDRPEKVITLRQQEVELPQQLEVVYIDKDADYHSGSQYEQRQVTNSVQLETFDVPLALHRDTAKQIAVKKLAEIWTSRQRYQLSVGRKYTYLDPADRIEVVADGETLDTRVEQISNEGGVLALEAVAEDPNSYVSDATGEVIPGTDGVVQYPGPTFLYIVDAALMKDALDQAGVYVATLGYVDAWNGCNILRTDDVDINWRRWVSTNKDALLGKATTVLGDTGDPWIWDEGNTVNIRLLDNDDTLSTKTKLQVLNWQNHAFIGNQTDGFECVGFRTATLESDGSYTLSGLLRGRKGTDWATGQHAVGDYFVFLDESRLHFMPMNYNEEGDSYNYRAISYGLSLLSATTKEFTPSFEILKPLSGVFLNGTRDATDNITVTWIRRTRVGGEWNDGGDVPLGEQATSSFSADLYEGSVLQRTKPNITSGFVYSKAEQNADGVTPGAPITVEVFQVSSIIGRGHVVAGTF